MSALRELLRNPLKLVIWLLLLTAAVTFFCLGAGVFVSARHETERINDNFVTIALPKQIKTESTELEQGMSWTAEEGVTDEMVSILEEMKQEGVVRGIYRQRYINGYSPQLTALSRIPSGEAAYPESAQQGGIFVIEIESVEEVKQQEFWMEGGGSVQLRARILETLAAHPDLPRIPRAKLSLDCPYEGGEEKLKALKLEPGRRFIIRAEAVTDGSLWVKNMISSILGIAPEEVDFDRIDYNVPEELIENMKKQNMSPERLPVAIYQTEDQKSSLYLSRGDLDLVDSLEIILIDNYGLYENQWMPAFVTNEKGELVVDTEGGVNVKNPFADRVLPAFAEEIEGDTEAFLASHPDWADAVREMEIRIGSAGLMGTDYLEGLYSFQSREAEIIQGRSFELKEYQEGAAVCIISDSLAKKSGLAVGDSIELSPYWGMIKEIFPLDIALNGIQTQPYSGGVGFEGEPRSYKIVGLYRLDDMWKEGQYFFNANMIFIPNAAMPAEGFSCNSGLFLSVVIQNGRGDDFKKSLAEHAFPEDSFVVYDGGYAGIAGSLRSLQEGSRRLLIAGAAVLAAALAVFMALFVSRQKYNLGLMRSLGASDKASFWRVMRTCLIPLAASCLMGAGLGAIFLEGVQRRILGEAAAAEAFGAPFPLAAVPAGAAAFLLFFLGCCGLLSRMGKASPAQLLKRQ